VVCKRGPADTGAPAACCQQGVRRPRVLESEESEEQDNRTHRNSVTTHGNNTSVAAHGLVGLAGPEPRQGDGAVSSRQAIPGSTSSQQEARQQQQQQARQQALQQVAQQQQEQEQQEARQQEQQQEARQQQARLQEQQEARQQQEKEARQEQQEQQPEGAVNDEPTERVCALTSAFVVFFPVYTLHFTKKNCAAEGAREEKGECRQGSFLGSSNKQKCEQVGQYGRRIAWDRYNSCPFTP